MKSGQIVFQRGEGVGVVTQSGLAAQGGRTGDQSCSEKNDDQRRA